MIIAICIFYVILSISCLSTCGCTAFSIPTDSSYVKTSTLHTASALQTDIVMNGDLRKSAIRDSIPLLIKNLKGIASIPLPKAHIFKRVAFGWAKELLDLGNVKVKTQGNALELKDLWKLKDQDLMENVSNRFDDYLHKEVLIDQENPNKYIDSHGNAIKMNILQEFWSYPATRAIAKMYVSLHVIFHILI